MLLLTEFIFSFLAVAGVAASGIYTKSLRGVLIAGLALTSLGSSALPWNRLPVSGVAISLLMLLSASAIFYAFQRRGSLLQVVNPYTKALLAVFVVIVGWLVLSGPTANYGSAKAALFLVKGILPAVAFLALGPYSRKDWHVLLSAIIFCSILLALRWWLSDAAEIARTKYAHEFSPITVGRIIGMGLPITLVLFLLSRRVSSAVVFLGIACLLGFAVLLPGSRGPVLAAGVAVGATSLLALLFTSGFNRALFFMKTGTLVGAAMLLTGFYITLGQQLGLPGVERIFSYYSEFEVEETVDEARFHHLQMAVQGFVESRGLGMGTGGYTKFFAGGEGTRMDGLYPHNLFAEFLVEQGIVGLGALLLLLTVVGRQILFVMRRGGSGVFGPTFCAFWIFAFINAMVSANIVDNFHLWIGSALLFIPTIGMAREAQAGPHQGHLPRARHGRLIPPERSIRPRPLATLCRPAGTATGTTS